MLDNQTNQGNFADQNITEGTPVYDVNGDKVGEVSGRGLTRNTLLVQKGVIFPKDLYIPLSAISRGGAEGVYLNLSKSEIKDQGWDTPPTDSMTNDTTNDMAGSTAMTGAPAMADRPLQEDRTLQEDTIIPVREEGLVANKDVEQTGSVHIHRGVTEEPEILEAPVSHEEVILEHRLGSDQAVGDDAFTEKDIDIPVMGEQLHADKETYVVGETRVRKEQVTDPEVVSGTVRREYLEVDGAHDDILGSERSALPDESASDASTLDYDPLERRDRGLDEQPLP